MTDTEINIAIAELCGWTDVHIWEDFNSNSGLKEIRGILPSGCQSRVPNYSQDLNAMHEAEKTLLTGDGWRKRLEQWSGKLMTVMHQTDYGRIDVAFHGDMVGLRYFTAHATARQRAEAFIRVRQSELEKGGE